MHFGAFLAMAGALASSAGATVGPGEGPRFRRGRGDDDDLRAIQVESQKLTSEQAEELWQLQRRLDGGDPDAKLAAIARKAELESRQDRAYYGMLIVVCPTCGAVEKQSCKRSTLGRYSYHRARLDAYNTFKAKV